ncbi:hypothetical protein CFC21_074878 [Triticum aestivum]|uniref:F-box domain-containing protein n=2 Tax=Triticum aestivum TaxID=4565 RepID=A0A9R1KWR3_WHEAT|nr:F-box protein At5g25290-like [Triticum aestivum]KAF7069217.1 hypothetical protein CFC21_074878 [Triticum aestivum]
METEIVVRNLPELPRDVLMDIFALLEIPDLMRAASVCSSWRSVYTSLGSELQLYKRPQTPCLLYTSESAADNVACLYSLAEKRVYNLTLPDPPIRSRYLIGSSHGWLITADEKSELHLLNPITCQQIALPSVITNERVKPVFDDAGTIKEYEWWEPKHDIELDCEVDGHHKSTHALDKLRDLFYIRARIFPDPSTESYIVVLTHSESRQLSFARVGDCKWTLLPVGYDYQDCIYMDGLLYAFTSFGQIDTFDLNSPTITRNRIIGDMKTYTQGRLYVLQAPSGDLLQVHRNLEIQDTDDDDEEFIFVTNNILLYKVDMAAKDLVLVNDLHDQVLFLGCNQSQYLSAEEFSQLKPNCVYFTDDDTCASEDKNCCRDIGVLNLENNKREEILPQLWCSWPNPIWVTPSLARMNWGCTNK